MLVLSSDENYSKHHKATEVENGQKHLERDLEKEIRTTSFK